MLLAASAVGSQRRCLRQEIAWSRQLAIQSNLVELEGRYSERVCTVPLDVTNEAQAKAAFEAATASFGGLDVLVNNASYGDVCPVEDTPLAGFRAQIETNLFGAKATVHGLLHHEPVFCYKEHAWSSFIPGMTEGLARPIHRKKQSTRSEKLRFRK